MVNDESRELLKALLAEAVYNEDDIDFLIRKFGLSHERRAVRDHIANNFTKCEYCGEWFLNNEFDYETYPYGERICNECKKLLLLN